MNRQNPPESTEPVGTTNLQEISVTPECRSRRQLTECGPYRPFAMRILATGAAGGGAFAISACWVSVRTLRFWTAAADRLGSLGIRVLWGLPDVHSPRLCPDKGLWAPRAVATAMRVHLPKSRLQKNLSSHPLEYFPIGSHIRIFAEMACFFRRRRWRERKQWDS